MNKKQLKERVLAKLIKKVLSENAPAKPDKKEEPVVAPNEPGEKKPERRRRDLRPDKDKSPIPKHMPAKAVGLKEEDMLNKIVARFKSKDKKELKEASSKIELSKHHQDQISDLSPEQKKELHKDLADATTEVNDKDFKTKAEYAKAMKVAKTKVYKKYIKL
jgi:hypothetical protein